MPFIDPHRPSIQLGLLKAIGEQYGFPVRTYHAHLDFAAQIGIEYYKLLCQHRGTLVGDWLFSLEAFGDAAPDPGAHMIDEVADNLSHLGASPEKRSKKSFSEHAAVMSPYTLMAWLRTFLGKTRQS